MTEQDAIAEFLATHEVTKCPTVCLVKTTGKISKEERQTLRRHQKKQNSLADDRFKRMFHMKMVYFTLGLLFIPLVRLLS